MTPTEYTPGEDRAAQMDDEADMADMDVATSQLRRHIDPRWVEIADRVLNKALLATRRSQPIQAQAPGGPVKVSEHVLTTYIRAAIADIPAAAPVAILATVDQQRRCTGITISITVQYNRVILPIADEIRQRTEVVLREVLGDVIPVVTIKDMHVHVDEVSTADPHTGREPD